MIALLNSSVLADFGVYEFRPLSLEGARQLAAEGVCSAIGHQETAEFLTELLGVPVPVNRIIYVQQSGEKVLVFRLKNRSPAGAVLDRQQLEEQGYTLGILERLS